MSFRVLRGMPVRSDATVSRMGSGYIAARLIFCSSMTHLVGYRSGHVACNAKRLKIFLGFFVRVELDEVVDASVIHGRFNLVVHLHPRLPCTTPVDLSSRTIDARHHFACQ